MGLKNLVYKLFSLANYYYWPVSLNRYKKINFQEPFLISFTAAETIFLKLSAASFNYNPDYSRGYHQKQINVVELPNVTFLGNSGALVLNNKIVTDSVFDQGRLTISPAYRSPALMWHRYKKGCYTSVIHLPWAQTSNYHWFFDCLPRLVHIIKSYTQPLKLIVNADIPLFQLETLQFILKDFSNVEVVSISKYEKWTVEQFIFPSFVTNANSGYLPLFIADILREKIWSGYGVTDNHLPAHLYISRKKATKRKIINEPELLPALQKFKFEIIYAEELTYTEQVRLFYNAKLVVAPHGAGLTNILFSKKCMVLELQAADVIKTHYFLAAKALGHSYHYLIGSNSDAKLNFSIDPKQFEQKLLEISGE